MSEREPTVRPAARVILLDETDRVLLARFEYEGRSWWCAPGGRLEGSESHRDAARREVAEETGFEIGELGPWIWTREHVFRFRNRLYRQQERYFVANVPAFEARLGTPGDAEAETMREMRWWSVRELEISVERFAPADLPALVRRLVEEGPPEGPVPVGV